MLPEGQLSRSINTGLIGWGVFFIISGILCGGGWTILTYDWEILPSELRGRHERRSGVPLATILTLVATLAWLACGVVLIARASRSGSPLVQAVKGWGPVAFLLLLAAACGYLFGFVVCVNQ
jgi:hypothetical protein